MSRAPWALAMSHDQVVRSQKLTRIPTQLGCRARQSFQIAITNRVGTLRTPPFLSVAGVQALLKITIPCPDSDHARHRAGSRLTKAIQLRSYILPDNQEGNRTSPTMRPPRLAAPDAADA